MNRRSFIARAVLGVAVLYVSGMNMMGCAVSLDVIIAYVQAGIKAVNAVLAVLNKLGVTVFPAGGTVAMIIQLVINSLNAIISAIQAYLAAPAADKATTKLKITLAIDAAINQIQVFWSGLGINNPTVEAIITALIAGLEGFLPQLPVPPGGVLAQRRGGPRYITVSPKLYRKPADFQNDINSILVKGGYSNLQIN